MAVIFRGSRNRKPETEFRQACIRWLKLRFSGRIWHLRTIGGLGQRTGIPDDLFCIRCKDGIGRFVAIEFKAPGNNRTGPRQNEELKAIRRCGGVAGMVNSIESLEQLLSEIEPTQMSIKDGKP